MIGIDIVDCEINNRPVIGQNYHLSYLSIVKSLFGKKKLPSK